jgi:hypothetical protein
MQYTISLNSIYLAEKFFMMGCMSTFMEYQNEKSI